MLPELARICHELASEIAKVIWSCGRVAVYVMLWFCMNCCLAGRSAGRSGEEGYPPPAAVIDSLQQRSEVQLREVLISPWRPAEVSCTPPCALLCQGFDFFFTLHPRAGPPS